MSRSSAGDVTLPIHVVEEMASCPGCGAGAVLHQPDIDLPDRLLATCEACGTWSLVVILPDGDRALAIPLPGGATLLERSGPPLSD